jgi:hypothetical protein
MTRHPYLRAYLAGILVPTLVLPGIMLGYILMRYVDNIPIPVERIIVFPMAAVPNIWGLWNVLYVARLAPRRFPIGLFGAILPLILMALGYLVARAIDFPIPAIIWHLLPVLAPVAMVLYHFVWRHFVGFLNSELAVT